MGTISVFVIVAAVAVSLVIVGAIGAPLLMAASKIVLKKSVTFGQAFLIVAACGIFGYAITWPVQAGIGDIPEGQTLAQIMGWAISFGIMTAMVDKATAAGLTRSATVAALNLVFWLAIWLVAHVALMGALRVMVSGLTKSMPGLGC